jgi:anti-repressor protein
MTEIQPFAFPATGQPVRALNINGEPWLVIADLCSGLDLTNPTMAAGRLDPR